MGGLQPLRTQNNTEKDENQYTHQYRSEILEMPNLGYLYTKLLVMLPHDNIVHTP